MTGSKIEKIILLICISFFFTLGAFTDRVLLDIPYLQLDPKINILGLANFIFSVALAVYIPFVVKKTLEEKRDQKVFLIEDFKELILSVKRVKSIISEAHSDGSFSVQNRDSIVYIFGEALYTVYSITEQIKAIFGNNAEYLSNNLLNIFLKYEEHVTGGKLMKKSFINVDKEFYGENNKKYNQFETEVKKLIYEIYKL